MTVTPASKTAPTTTNASGIATVGNWTLGTTAGSNTLTATATGLAGSPVTFTATGTAGAATQVALNAGNVSGCPTMHVHLGGNGSFQSGAISGLTGSACSGAGCPPIAPYPTQQLVDRFLPDVPRRREFAGREVPIDLRRAALIGFTAEHLWPLEERAL